MLSCEICHVEFKRISATHLRKHNTTQKEYKARFPLAKIDSDEVRSQKSSKISSSLMGQKKSPEHAEKLRCPRSEEACRNMSVSAKVRTSSAEWRLAHSDKIKSAWVRARENGTATEWHSKCLKALYSSPNITETFLAEQFPENLRFVGDSSYWVVFNNGRRKNPDFKVKGKKAVVELFGRYWHPEPEEEYTLIELYKQIGYDCLVIWDDDLLNKRESTLQRIGGFIL